MKRTVIAVLATLCTSPAMANPITLSCAISEHFILTDKGKKIQEETHTFTRTITLNDNGEFVELTIDNGVVVGGAYTVTPKRYILRFENQTMDDNSGYIDRETGQLYLIFRSEPGPSSLLVSQETGTCAPERANPRF